MFYSAALLRTIAQDCSLSGSSDRLCSKEVREEPRHIGVFEKKKKKKRQVVEYQMITTNHKNRHPKLMILVLFHVWEDARVWAYGNHSFDICLNYLGPVPCFSP